MKALRLVLLLTFISPASAFIVPLYFFVVDLVCAFLGLFGFECGNENDAILEQSCLDSGGEVSTASCCSGTGNFPDSCVVGPCGCAPWYSEETKVCHCATDQCFNGTHCVLRLLDSCVSSDGEVSTASCCNSTEDFPNTCLVGACGCAPDNSKQTKVCECPTGQCFDGFSCTWI